MAPTPLDTIGSTRWTDLRLQMRYMREGASTKEEQLDSTPSHVSEQLYPVPESGWLPGSCDVMSSGSGGRQSAIPVRAETRHIRQRSHRVRRTRRSRSPPVAATGSGSTFVVRHAESPIPGPGTTNSRGQLARQLSESCTSTKSSATCILMGIRTRSNTNTLRRARLEMVTECRT